MASFSNSSGSVQRDKRIFLEGIQIKGGDVEFITANPGHLICDKIKPVGDFVTVYSSLSVTGTLSAAFDLNTQGTTASATDASNRLATTAFVYNAIPNSDLFTTVNSNSAGWAATYSTVVYNNSAGWENAESTARAGSAAWWTTHSAVTANSAAWTANEGESTVRNNSGNWDLGYTTSVANTAAISHLRSSSADWANTYTTVKTESAGWETAGSSASIGHVPIASGAWWSAYSNVSANSGDWNNTETVTRANSGDWNNSETVTRTNSGDWNNVYTDVNANSADWNYVAANSATIFEDLTVHGTISALGSLTANDIYLNDGKIYGTGGSDTYIDFGVNDEINFYGGGERLMKIDEASDDQVLIGDDGHVNFRVATYGYGYNLYVKSDNTGGVDNSVGVRNSSPQAVFHVKGDMLGTGSAGVSGNISAENYLSAGGIVYADGGSSVTWNNAETALRANSGDWENTESTVRSNSGSWAGSATNLGHVPIASGAWWSGYSNVSANSGDWNNTETVTRANSGDWENTESTVRSNSGSWSGTSLGHVNVASGAWWTAHSTVSANSADWNNNETVTRANSGDWGTSYDNMITTMSLATGTGILTLTQQDGGTVTEDLDGRYITSSVTGVAGYVPAWGASHLTLGETVLYHSTNRIGINTESLSIAFTVSGAGTQEASISARDLIYAGGYNSIQWNNAYETVKANSGDWENVWTSVNTDSGDWNNAETALRANSGDWENTESTVRSNSSTWGSGVADLGHVPIASGAWWSAYSNVSANSSDWENAWTTTNSTSSVWTTVNADSADWNNTETALRANSGDWNNTETALRANSGDWENTESTVRSNSSTWGSEAADLGHVPIASGAWWSGYSNVSANSSDWNNTETVVRDASADWNNTDTTVGSGSAKWWSTHNAVTANSGAWDNTTTTVKSKSADWNNAWTTVNTDSADWNNAWSVQNTNSANWITTHSGVLANSGDWENAWTTVNTDSADWNNTETALRANSGDWDNTETVTRANSATWSSGGAVNTTVNANSAVWSYPLSAQRVATEVTVSNTFAVGNILRKGTSTNYHKAQADSAANADVIGIVIAASSSKFTYVHSGYATIASHGFTIGNIVFLSDSSAGALTETETTTVGSVTKPIGTVIDSNTILVEPLRGMIIASTGATASAAAGWTKSGTLIYSTETSDTVTIGTNVAGERLTVKGNISASGDIYCGNDLTIGGGLTATGALVTSGIHNYGHTNTIQPEFSATNLQIGVISGPATISTTHNKQAGASITLRLSAYNTNCALTWNSSWIFVGTKPTILPTDKYGVLSLQCFGTADTDVVASFAISN